MRLTGRGVTVLVVGVVLFGAGELLGFALFRALAGVAAGMLLVAMTAAVRRPLVTVHRELYPDRVECGRPALARLQVHNPDSARHPGFTAKDVVGDIHVDVVVRPLAGGAVATHHYELPTGRRGRLVVGPLTLERFDPFRLARSQISTGETATLWVHPRRYPVHSAMVGWPRHHHEGPVLAVPLPGSSDLRTIREYMVGDEVRHLHWKAMARTGTLMVREYVDPARPRFTLLLDNRAGVLAEPVFEAAVEVVASLVFAAAEADHRTRLLATSGLDLDTGGGFTAARELLDRLAEIEQVADGAAAPLPRDLVGAGAGGAVVLVTGGRAVADAAMLAALGAPRSRLTVIDMCPRAGVVAAPGVHILRADSAADAIRAWNSGSAA